MTKKSLRKISGGEWKNFVWRMGKFWVEKPFWGKCLKNGHRKFGVPGNVTLQKTWLLGSGENPKLRPSNGKARSSSTIRPIVFATKKGRCNQMNVLNSDMPKIE